MKCRLVWLSSTIGTVIFATSLVAPVVHADAKRGSSAKVEEPYDPAVRLRHGFHVEERPHVRGGLVGTGMPLLMIGTTLIFLLASEQYLETSKKSSSAYSVGYLFGGLSAGFGTLLLVVGLSSSRFVLVPGEPAKGEPWIPTEAAASALRWRNDSPEVDYANGPKAPEARLSFGLDSVGTGTGLTFSGAF